MTIFELMQEAENFTKSVFKHEKHGEGERVETIEIDLTGLLQELIADNNLTPTDLFNQDEIDLHAVEVVERASK